MVKFHYIGAKLKWESRGRPEEAWKKKNGWQEGAAEEGESLHLELNLSKWSVWVLESFKAEEIMRKKLQIDRWIDRQIEFIK